MGRAAASEETVKRGVANESRPPLCELWAYVGEGGAGLMARALMKEAKGLQPNIRRVGRR